MKYRNVKTGIEIEVLSECGGAGGRTKEKRRRQKRWEKGYS